MGLIPKRIYLDSCVVIYRVEVRSPWYGLVDAALTAHAQDEFCVSDLVRLECRMIPIRMANTPLLAQFDQFLASTTLLALDTTVYDLATDLRATHGLKTPDAIHLAAALTHGCEEFWTNDLRLARATSALAFRTF